jgi:hypothetical protein
LAKRSSLGLVFLPVADAFANFLYSFGAARKLLRRAYERGALIEALALYVSLIDGMLRIAIILDKQIVTAVGEFDESYIRQESGGKRYTEKAIYEEALSRGIIDVSLHSEVVALYEERNKIVHRFFLTNVKYAEIGPHLDRYEAIYRRCYEIVYELEARQIEGGVGMTRAESKPTDSDAIDRDVAKKLGFPIE